MTKSVLSAANSSTQKIDQKMAEMMNKESVDLKSPDLVMIPSMNSVTGWKFVNNKHLDQIRQ